MRTAAEPKAAKSGAPRKPGKVSKSLAPERTGVLETLKALGAKSQANKQTVGQIAKAMKLGDTKPLAGVLKELVGSGLVGKAGEKRGTGYWAKGQK